MNAVWFPSNELQNINLAGCRPALSSNIFSQHPKGGPDAPSIRELHSCFDSPILPGVQTLVPILLDHVAEGRLSLSRFVDMTSAGPARLFGIAGKGRIAAGYDADLTLVDLKRQVTITDEWIASRCGWTPYAGRRVTGWPVATIVRGHVVMREGELVAAGQGAPIRFHDSLRVQAGRR